MTYEAKSNYVRVVKVDVVPNPKVPTNGGHFLLHLACGHTRRIRQYRGQPKRSHCPECSEYP